MKETAYCRYTHQPLYTLRMTCDNNLQYLYVDGALKHAHNTLPHTTNWKKESVISISPTFKVIAIKAVNYGGPEGLLASVQDLAGKDIQVTDGSWKCSNSWQKGWEGLKFIPNSIWQAAKVMASHGDTPWGKIGQISANAKWIWSQTGGTTSYCRFEV